MTTPAEENKILSAINSLRETVAGVPHALQQLAAIRVEVSNLSGRVESLERSDKTQNRFIWLAVGGLATLVFVVEYGGRAITFLSSMGH